MNKEQLRIYNENRKRKGLSLYEEEGDSPSFLVTNADVYPYTVGFLGTTPVTDSYTIEDLKTSVSKELDSISSSTQFLFDAADSAQQAADDAKVAYDNAQEAQAAADAAQDDATQALSDADAAMQEAIDANTASIANAQDIVTLQGDFESINTTVGALSDTVTGISTTVSAQGESITEVTSIAQDASDTADGTATEYETQWGIKSDVNGIQRGIGFVQSGSSSKVVVDADQFIVGTDLNNPVFSVSGDTITLNGNVKADSIEGDMVNIAMKNIGTNGTATFTIADDQDFPRIISIAPFAITASTGEAPDHSSSSINVNITRNGTNVGSWSASSDNFEKNGYYQGATCSYEGTMTPGAGTQTIKVTVSSGIDDYAGVSCSGCMCFVTKKGSGSLVVS